MDKEYVKNVASRICQFMQKSQMTGVENTDYTECWNVLNALIGGDLSLIETPILMSLKESDEEVKIMQAVMNKYPKVVGAKVDAMRDEMNPNQAAPAPPPDLELVKE